MKHRIQGPDGTTFLLEGSDEAIHAAIDEIFGEEKQPRAEPVDHGPAMLDALERLLNRPDPAPISLKEVVEAIKKLDKEPAPQPDFKAPLRAHSDELNASLGRQTAELCDAVARQGEEIAQLRADLVALLQTLHKAIASPRKLVRDQNGRPLRAEIVMDGE